MNAYTTLYGWTREQWVWVGSEGMWIFPPTLESAIKVQEAWYACRIAEPGPPVILRVDNLGRVLPSAPPSPAAYKWVRDLFRAAMEESHGKVFCADTPTWSDPSGTRYYLPTPLVP